MRNDYLLTQRIRPAAIGVEQSAWGGPHRARITAMDQVRVLVVDDHEGFRDLMEVTVSLEPAVIEVRTASHGREAIELCQTFAPDVVFVDSLLPEMTGDEVSHRIKTLHPKARVISLSGQSEWEPRYADEKISKAGSDFLDEVARAVGHSA